MTDGRIESTERIVAEINELLHDRIDKEWSAREWRKRQAGAPIDSVHPFINVTFDAHKQIERFMETKQLAITPEIWELTELALKINRLHEHNTKGLPDRIRRLTSHDHSLYLPTRYELQVGGMLVGRGYEVEFLEAGSTRTPDLLAKCAEGECEIECKHKQPSEDNVNLVQSIYQSTQTARKQFSKQRVGLIMIDIGQPNFDGFERERKRLEEEVVRAMRNSGSISGVFLTSKIAAEDDNDFIYRHRVIGYVSTEARHPIPGWLGTNLVN